MSKILIIGENEIIENIDIKNKKIKVFNNIEDFENFINEKDNLTKSKLSKEIPAKTYFKNRLKFFRLKEKITQVELGKILGLSRSTIVNYEIGKAEPSLETLKKLAEMFNTSADFLIGKNNK